MKTCTRCKKSKNLNEFRKRTKSPDGLSVWCTQCFRDYDRERYKTVDKARKQAGAKAITERNRDFMWDLLLNSKCTDCGIADPLVLEFDHKDGSGKEENIGRLIQFSSLDRLKSEIAKCEVRCANCHRKRTIKQFGLWRGNR